MLHLTAYESVVPVPVAAMAAVWAALEATLLTPAGQLQPGERSCLKSLFRKRRVNPLAVAAQKDEK